MKRSLILVCLTNFSVAINWEMDSMAFAFYYSRHGARTPAAYEGSDIYNDHLKLFDVAPGELTA